MKQVVCLSVVISLLTVFIVSSGCVAESATKAVPLPHVDPIKWEEVLYASLVATVRCSKVGDEQPDVANLMRVGMVAMKEERFQHPDLALDELMRLNKARHRQTHDMVIKLIAKNGCDSLDVKQMIINFQVFSKTKYVFPDGRQDGHNCEAAIDIDSVKGEYVWLAMHYPQYKFIRQSLISCPNYPADQLDIVLADGTQKSVYFNICLLYTSDAADE